MTDIPELIAMYDALTTPQSEDWHIIVDGDTAHVTAFHEDDVNGRTLVSIIPFKTTLRDLKMRIRKPPRYSRPLGCITVIFCSDNIRDSKRLLGWFARVGKRHVMSVVSTHSPDPAADALALQHALNTTPPPGWTVAREVCA